MRVCLTQLDCTDRGQNVEVAFSVLEKSASNGVDLVVFPEMYLHGYNLRELKRCAETVKGKTITALREAARKHNIAFVMGFPEKAGDYFFNSALFVDRHGEVLCVYRKCHLFGDESKYFATGSEFPVIEFSNLTMGIAICYDIEFPETARILALRGARFLIVPTANMRPYEEDHEVFARSRALENGCFLVTVNRVGNEAGYEFFGRSCVVEPDGSVLVRLGENEDIQSVELDTEKVKHPKLNYLIQRRPTIYDKLTQC